MPKVSVVIPVYNSSAYISQCLDSLLSQTLRDIEIICVDDCSTDDSRNIILHYASIDPRVRFVAMKSNSGPSTARNRGMYEATGDYIGFIDSDDWVDTDFYEVMLNVAERHGADYVLNTTYVREFADHTEPLSWLYAKYPKMGIMVDAAYCANIIYGFPHARLISRSLIVSNGLEFPVQFNMHEDEFFHRISCNCVREIAVCGGSTYHYRNNESSLTNVNRFSNSYFLTVIQALKNYYGDRIYAKDFRLKLFSRMLFSHITPEGYDDIKSYIESLKPYFAQSGVSLSDFDKFSINNIIASTSHTDLMKRIGRDPWVRYNTMERIKNKAKVKVSVIIPIYNTEPYLSRCLDSVCGQTLHDIEIICVNDASTDNSLVIARQYAFEDNRIIIINEEENKGVSNARNIAMEKARGEYIYFIDSDDWIDRTFLATMLETMEHKQADILVNTHFVKEYDDHSTPSTSFSFSHKNPEDVDATTIQRLFPPVVWARLYRRTFLTAGGIFFPVGINHGEDIFFTAAADLTAGHVCVFEGDNYHYYQRSSSAIHNNERGFHYIESFAHLFDFIQKNQISVEGVKLFYVESLIIDTAEKYNFVRHYLKQIKHLIIQYPEIYNEQELFLLRITDEISEYETFKKHYNPNIALSFIRHRMTQRK